jgi:hypothetical protein
VNAKLRGLAPAVVAVAASALLAGCGARGGQTSPAAYVTCTQPADGCTVVSQMKSQPTAMNLSGDGTLYVQGITWRGWGTATATGTGTASLDNCKPNCAQGSYAKHPATLVLSDPRSWHGKMAYSRQTDSVPAAGWHFIFAHGLLPGVTPPAVVTTPPAPGPVSTTATLNGTCTMGYEAANTNSSGNIAYGPFTAGQPPGPVTIGSERYTATVAYQVSLTNTGTVTAEASGWAVAFYDANGNELSSDQESAGDTFITASQTLTWTMYSGTDLAGYGLSGDGGTGSQDGNVPATGDATTCSFLQWYHP